MAKASLGKKSVASKKRSPNKHLQPIARAAQVEGAVALVAGALAAALLGAILPIEHAREYLRPIEITLFGKYLRWGIWEYEFWGHFFGIAISAIILIVRFLNTAIRFSVIFGITLGVVIYARATEYHAPVETIFGGALVSLICVFLIRFGVVVFGKIQKKLNWEDSLSSRMARVVSAILIFISFASWFDVQARDLLPFLEPKKASVLNFARAGGVVELHGDDGLAEPVVVLGRNAMEYGVMAEYYWINKYYPRFRPVAQGLRVINPESKRGVQIIKLPDGSTKAIELQPTEGVRYYDLVIVVDWMGRRKDIIFEITDFYRGKSIDLKLIADDDFFISCTLKPPVPERVLTEMQGACPKSNIERIIVR